MADPRIEQPEALRTANQVYFDSAIRHQMGVRRFASGEAKRLNKLVALADAELIRFLRSRLPRFANKRVNFRSKQYLQLLKDLRSMRKKLMKEVRNEIRPTLTEFSRMEVDFEKRILESSIPIAVLLSSVTFSTLSDAIDNTPLDGRLLQDWYTNLEQTDNARITRTLGIGLSLQESVDVVIRRIAGTRENRFRDGALAATRRGVEGVARTAINSTSNIAREELWKANRRFILGLRWTATLDGRTTAICRHRDGRMAPLGDKPLPKGVRLLDPPHARPPAHFACRSIMVAVLDGVGIIGQRPFITDIRTPQKRRVDFRQLSRRTGTPINDLRQQWAKRNVGTVPGKMTYFQWLRTQPSSFQDQVLGKTKGKLFRTGKLPDDVYVDRQGQELTLKQLAKTNPEAFASANLRIENFI